MNSSSSAADPKESAAIILVRKKVRSSWEVFLARRHQRQSFMAGAFVFPGGQVDEADGTLADYIRVPDHFDPVRLLQDNALSFAEAIRLYICAIRETFEEAGVMLAKTANNQYPDEARMAISLSSIRKNATTLKEIAGREQLFFPLDELIPYAHWITPEIVPKRFTTRFFLACLPQGQSAKTDSVEMTDCLWVRPKDALGMYRKKEIALMPPTLKTLEELSTFATLNALWAFARKKKIYPVLPQPVENMLKLPHDPEYGIEKYKQPAGPGDPSRIILEDGIWRTGFCPES